MGKAERYIFSPGIAGGAVYAASRDGTVARLDAASGREAALRSALARTTIAAVGPVVAEAIEEAGGRVAVAPAQSFHMKPMVNAIVAAIGS